MRSLSTLGRTTTAIAVATLGLVTTAGASASTRHASKSVGGTIGFLVPEEGQNFYSAAYVKDVQTAAKQMGVKVTILNSNYTASTQQAQMKELIAEKVKGIVLWPGVAGSTLPMLVAAKKAGIPVDISNSIVPASQDRYFHTYTGTDDFGKGEALGDLVAKDLHDTGNIVVVLGQPGAEPTTNILKGLKAAFAKVAPKIKILATQPADWEQAQAETATASLLSRYNGQLQAVVAEDDDMAAGSAQALESGGLVGKIKLFGMGYYPPTPALLKSGTETGTLFQSPCWDGVMALRTIVKVVEGKKTPKSIYMPVPAVQKGTKYKPAGCVAGVTA